ncbi:MAG TPA: WYL domain-containing protein [Acidimicrobiales bacterium]|nr:WYL domain-containing protein [Acidimicrobiales bacterium]
MSREGADARLGRLLAIVPWIAAHDGPSLEEVCRRFSVTEKDLLADLNLLFMCGVYPFTPDVLIDVHIADGRVWISMADYFRRPLRLNAQEGLALVSAGRTFLAFPDAGPGGPLATALEKLDTVLGLAGGEALDVELAQVDPDVLAGLRGAAERGEKVRIDYYSYGRDRRSSRVVHPWRVFNQGGEWYLEAWCESVAAERHFRLDRIEALEPTGDRFEPPRRTTGAPTVYHPHPDDPVWVLDLDPPAHWIAEQYPNESVEERDGGVLRVTLRAQRNAWLERVLLRAGRYGRVVEGDASVGREAAGRLLALYRASGD